MAGVNTIVTPSLGRAIIAVRAFSAGEAVLTQVGDPVRREPNVFTIQIADKAHVEVLPPMRYTAHSCDPNVRVSWELSAGGVAAVSLVAIRHIAPGALRCLLPQERAVCPGGEMLSAVEVLESSRHSRWHARRSSACADVP
jgi:hypothetical protein